MQQANSEGDSQTPDRQSLFRTYRNVITQPTKSLWTVGCTKWRTVLPLLTPPPSHTHTHAETGWCSATPLKIRLVCFRVWVKYYAVCPQSVSASLPLILHTSRDQNMRLNSAGHSKLPTARGGRLKYVIHGAKTSSIRFIRFADSVRMLKPTCIIYQN
jgi:hypothetical protein